MCQMFKNSHSSFPSANLSTRLSAPGSAPPLLLSQPAVILKGFGKQRYQNIPRLLKLEAHTVWQTIHSINALDAAQKNMSHSKAQTKQAAATYFQKRNFIF